MDLTEYTEKFVTDGFKREFDQEENVARSLPFFATSLAVLVAIIGAVHSNIPPLSWALYAAVTWGLLGVLGFFILLAIVNLWRAVRRRAFLYPLPETDFQAWTESLREYYVSAGSTDPDGETLKDVRAGITAQQAKAAENNRAINNIRVVARAHALTSLILALFVAFALIATILVHDGTDGTSHVAAITKTAAPSGKAGLHGSDFSQARDSGNAGGQ